MNPHDASILRGAAVPTAAVGLIAVVIGALVAGGKGALGALVGTLVVLVFFSISVLVVGRAQNAALMMNLALLTYVVKILLLFGFLVAFQDTTLFDTKVFALTIVTCTLVWTAFELRAFTRLKILYADPDEAGRH